MKTPRKKAFKLRLDLLEYVTDQDIQEEAIANISRYRAEPSLGKTGVGYLRPATPEEREAEINRSDKFTKKLKARAAAAKWAKRKVKS
jgi:hypothetical protein